MSQKIKQDISIGANLQFLRKRAGLSQEQVASKLQIIGLSVSREMVSQMELGRYSIRVSVLLALKEIYTATIEEFFAGVSL
jgi:transcriptional regulator with XRE-family HTH domain